MRRSLFRAATAAALSVMATTALAQYKWEGESGGIVYSDLPPPPGVRLITEKNGQPAREKVDTALPYAVKVVADKYPVTLYTVPDCQPCGAGRQLLNERGIPFAEKTLGSVNDIEAYKALGFSESSLPGLGVGNDRSTGFEAGAWNRLLDAAGYPKRSMLPSQYRQAEAQPLTPPPTQRVNVSIAEPATAAANAGEIRPAESTTAIERYRQMMREAEESRQRGTAQQPEIRF